MYVKKNRPFLIGGVILAVLLAALILFLVLGGGDGYRKHYDAAVSAYSQMNYGTAAKELNAALEEKRTEEAYLLLADVYLAQGSQDQAVQTLLLGYSHVGGTAIQEKLDGLGSETGSGHISGQKVAENVDVGGRSFAKDTISVVLSDRGLRDDDLETLCQLTGLENLSISDNSITNLSPIAGLEKLVSLQLSNNNVSDLRPLSGLGSLKTLYLDGNPLGDLSPLYTLKSLRTLSMKNVDVTDGELKSLGDALPDCYIVSDNAIPKAEQLNLGGQFFSTDDEEISLTGLSLSDISLLNRCTDLKKLDLRDNNISDLSALAGLENLEWLRLWNNQVEDLTALAGLKNLRYLDLDGNRIKDFSVLAELPGLEELWLSSNPLASLSPLSDMPGLKKLGLKNTGLTDGDLKALYGLKELKELYLEDNPELTAAGAADLQKELLGCDITSSPLYWTVVLGGTAYRSDITEIDATGKGIRDLSGLEHFDKLRTLILDDNDLNSLSPLYGLTGLRKLSVQGNPRLTESELARARRQLPNCEILSDPAETPEPAVTETPAPSESPASREEGRLGPADTTPSPTEATPAPAETTPPPAETPVSAEPDTETLRDRGAQAALDAAGTGSGYALFRMTGDQAGEAIREGFLDTARQLGMHMVYEGGAPAGTVNYSVFLQGMQDQGADVVFLAVDDWTFAEIVAQAGNMGYEPEFKQIYE